MKVITQTPVLDTLIWQIQEHRRYRHTYGFSYLGRDTSIDEDYTVVIRLLELQTGKHELFTRDNSFVFTFREYSPDSEKIYRYQIVDTNGNVTVTQYYQGEHDDFSFRQGIGLTDESASFSYFSSWRKNAHLVGSMLVSVSDPESQFPQEIRLFQNYPNPFNPSTSISFAISKRTHVRLQVFNLLGQIIETLVNDNRLPGSYTLSWNASGSPSGLYIYRMVAGEFIQTKKAVLLK